MGIKVKKIKFEQAEGKSVNCGWKEFSSWEGANEYIASVETPAANCGYYKCNVSVEFENGFEYGMRYDLSANREPLNLEYFSEISFYCGDSCPSHMKQETYERYMIECGAKIEAYKELRATLDFGLLESPEEIAARRELVVLERKRIEKEKIEKAAAWKAEQKIELLAKYPFMKEIGSCCRTVEVNKNIRAWIKFNFPGHKFSVSSRYYGSTTVKSETIPNRELNECVGAFEGGYFDGSDDCYKYSSNAFTELFGSVKYISAYGKKEEMAG